MLQENNNNTVFLKINKGTFVSQKDNTTTAFFKINKDIYSCLTKIIPLEYFPSASVSLYSYGAVGFIVTKALTENNLHTHRSKYC